MDRRIAKEDSLPRTEIRVETLEYGPGALLSRRGLREQMARVLMGLDVWLDPGLAIDEDFWGLLRSEIGRRGLSCDDLPKPVGGSNNVVGSIVILKESNLKVALEAVRGAVEHWMARGHSRERIIDLCFIVVREVGMERAEVRGPVGSIIDALAIGSDGFSEVGRRPP